MTDRDHPSPLLIEALRTQEMLKGEFQAMRELIESHCSQLDALNQRIAELHGGMETPSAHQRIATAVPHGLLPADLDDDAAPEHLKRIHQQIGDAFYPDGSAYLLDAPYIRVRRLHGIDLQGQLLAILTTPAWEYSDMFLATDAGRSIELQFQSVNGPAWATSWQSATGSGDRRKLTCDIESWPDELDAVDTIWIPDPNLASLVVNCRGLPERICAKVRRQLILSIDTQYWPDDAVRERLHLAGFTEIRRLSHDAVGPYTTRRHESRGFVVIDRAESATDSQPILHLIASKLPTASFRVVQPHDPARDADV